MFTRRNWSLPGLALVLVTGTHLRSQELTGGLNGSVIDASGKPLLGVTIFLESPALFQPRKVQTNAKGEWRASLLPVGNYTIKASKDAHLGQTVNSVRIGLGQIQRMDFTLKPLNETTAIVEVVAAALTESQLQTEVSVNFSAESLAKLPVSSAKDGAFNAALSLAPGFAANFGIRGSGAEGIAYSIDGIDVKDSATSSALLAPLPDSVEDSQVVLSGVNARNGRVSGGSVRLITKTGGNEFHGSLRAYMNRNAWTSNQPHAAAIDNASNSTEGINRYFDTTFSGPIWKDHIWFHAGARIQPTSRGTWQLDQPSMPAQSFPLQALPLVDAGTGTYPFDPTMANPVLAAGPGNGYSMRTPELGNTIPTTNKIDKYDLKITSAISADHIFTLSLLSEGTTFTSTGEQLPSQTRISSAYYGPTHLDRQAFTANWAGMISSNLSFETSLQDSSYKRKEFGGPASSTIPVWATLAQVVSSWGFTYGVPFSPVPVTGLGVGTPETHRSQSLTFNLKYHVDAFGTHDVDTGFELVKLGYNSGHASGTAGSRVTVGGVYSNDAGQMLFPTVRFVDPTLNGQDQSLLFGMFPAARFFTGPAPVYMKPLASAGDAQNYTDSIYINDIWGLNAHWSLNLGGRFNSYRIQDTDGSRIAKNTSFEPRFQVKWNPDGMGKHVVRLSLAKYAQEFTSAMSRFFVTDPYTVYSLSGWKGNNQPLPGDPSDPTGQYGVRFVTAADLTNPANYSTPYAFQDTRQLRAWSNVNIPYAQEISLAYNRTTTAGTVGISINQRRYYNELVRVADYGFSNFVLVQDPSHSGLDPRWQQRTTFTSSPYATTYRTAEFFWNEPITPRLNWGGSITYNIQTGRPTTAITSYPSLQGNPAYGSLPSDIQGEGVLSRGQKVLVHATYTFPVGRGGTLNLSFLGNYIEGTANNSALSSLTATTPYTNLPEMIDPTGHNYEVQPLRPNHTVAYSALGAYKTAGDTFSVDFKADWNIPIGLHGVYLVGGIQVSGVLNNHLSSQTPYLGTDMNFFDDGAVPGRWMRAFYSKPGSYPNVGTRQERNDYSMGRVVSEFSIGLKF